VTITPFNTAKRLTQATIEAELDKQIAAGVLPAPDADSMYMIHFPPGLQISISWGDACKTWVADHEVYRSPKYGNIYYAMMPDGHDCKQSGYSEWDTVTAAASHELAEAITDPMCPVSGQAIAYPAAWLTSDSQEIGDLCAWNNSRLIGPNGDYTVQTEYRNSLRACRDESFSK
jgi:hypothetical protein